MKNTILTIALVVASMLTFAQVAELEKYESYKADNNDTAAYNLIKNAFMELANDGGNVASFDQLIAVAEAFTNDFAECDEAEMEDDPALCERLEFFNTQVFNFIPEAYGARGAVKMMQKDYKGAITDLNIILKAKPESVGNLMNRGNAKYKVKDYNGSVADFTKVLKLDADNGKALFAKATSFFKLKKFDEAIADFNKILEGDAENSKAQYYIGLSYYQQKNYEEAVNAFDKLIEMNPENQKAYYYGGLSNYKNSNIDAAKANFLKATELNAKDKKSFFYLGYCHLATEGEAEKACAAWGEAKKLGYAKADKLISEHCNKE